MGKMSAYLGSDQSRLIRLSFLMLFVELVLIRWSSANVMYLTNISNFVLLASFLGIGIGFLRSKSSARLFSFAPFLLAIIVIGCYHFSYNYQVKINPSTDDLIFREKFFINHIYPEWFSLPFIFMAVTLLMVTIADEVARVFQTFPPLQAYRYETLGSLGGIIVFSGLSMLCPSPFCWGIVIGLLFVSLLYSRWRIKFGILALLQIMVLIGLSIPFAKETFSTTQWWSSYYKIETQVFSKNRYVVNVNGFPQQVIESAEQREAVKPFYALPYHYRVSHAALNNVLVIGAGTGGDVAVALAKGAKHVDAVEIDPMLYRLGKKLNPDQPYSDPRVSVFINDGRAFLQQSTMQYDMIIFALTDSLMLITGQSLLRLENYLYTVEAITTVKKHLKPDGIFTIYNYYGVNWVAQRLANTVDNVFHHVPCFTTESRNDYSSTAFAAATVLAISPSESALSCPAHWQPKEQQMVVPITDDRPFFYLPTNTLPTGYIIMLLFVLLMSIMTLRMTKISFYSLASHADLFLMGTAFLLLETKNIINFALLFGTTWVVSALVFIGVLSTLYFAIEVTHRFKVQPAILYVGLLLALFIAWIVPNSYLLTLPIYFRFLLGTAIAFSPIFFANLIFSARFKQTQQSSQAFGANLVGAVIGGMLEYTSLVIGYHDVLILIMALYFFAMVAMRLLQSASIQPSGEG